jgi:hypothetical protein
MHNVVIPDCTSMIINKDVIVNINNLPKEIVAMHFSKEQVFNRK